MKKLLLIFIFFSGNLLAQKIELPDSIMSLLHTDTTVVHVEYLSKTQGKQDSEGWYFGSYYNPHFIKEKRDYLTNHRVGKWNFYRKNGSIKMTDYIPYSPTDTITMWNYRKDGSLRQKRTMTQAENLKASHKTGKGDFKGIMTLQKVYAVWYYKNGNISSENTQIGLRNIGFYNTYYENGQIKEKVFRNLDHKRDGDYMYWYEDGSVMIQGQYKNGKKIGLWKTFDKDGKLKKEKNYKEKNQ